MDPPGDHVGVVSSKLASLEIEDPVASRTPASTVASSVDPHHAVVGGDLTSAVIGIVKGMVGPAILCKRNFGLGGLCALALNLFAHNASIAVIAVLSRMP